MMRLAAVALVSLLAARAYGAFPSVENSGSNITSPASSHSVSVGSPSSGEKVLIIGACTDSTDSSTDVTITPPDGYATILTGQYMTGARRLSTYSFTKTAAGTEGSSQSFATNLDAWCAWIFYNFSGFDTGQDLEAMGSGWSYTTNPDPPTLTPTGGSKDYLWISYAVGRGDYGDYTIPSGYSNRVSSLYSSSVGSLGAAQRTNAAASENPGTWNVGGDSTAYAATIAVHPVNTATGRVVQNKHGRVGSPEVIR